MATKKTISIHALREEGDIVVFASASLMMQFLSTPSARRATRLFALAMQAVFTFLSTPSARRATHP